MEQKFFLYARKSTDVEDKQIRSIEDQITELRAYAKQEKLEVTEELVEKQSAKIPGRPIFDAMVERIERREANGILAWHPDRLARNSVDGGRIIYLLDTGRLAGLKFPTFWFESTPQGKFMLNIAFGQSKYYVDSLSENTKRGLRQKVKRGEYPSFAPIGYLNDSRNKSVIVDKRKMPIVRKAFELYAQNNSRLEDISNFLAQKSVVSRSGKVLKRDRISFILGNPFYVGLFRYNKEVHEGKHEPAVSKKIFDQVQEILRQRGRTRHKPKNEPQAFCGLLKCGSCGMGITAETKLKRQKNGNVHNYVYYRCTKKNKLVKCNEPFIRQEDLDRKISCLLEKFSLKQDWADELLQMLSKEKIKTAQSSAAFVQEQRNHIQSINTKLQRLLDGYLEQVIEQEVYRTEKAKLLSEKKSLEEQSYKLEQKQSGWLEPMQNWIKQAQNIRNISAEGNLFEKKVAAKEIFGSNLTLSQKHLEGGGRGGTAKSGAIAPQIAEIRPAMHWAALRAAHQMLPEKGKSFILERITGIEPVCLAWEASVLPLYYIRSGHGRLGKLAYYHCTNPLSDC